LNIEINIDEIEIEIEIEINNEFNNEFNIEIETNNEIKIAIGEIKIETKHDETKWESGEYNQLGTRA